MNKKIFLIILMLLCVTVHGARKYDVERGNDLAHIEVARKISALEDVKDAAVLSCEGRVLAGIRTKKDVDASGITKEAEAMIKESFPKAKGCSLFVGNETADKVIELSFYVDSGMNRRDLRKRFEFLMN